MKGNALIKYRRSRSSWLNNKEVKHSRVSRSLISSLGKHYEKQPVSSSATAFLVVTAKQD